MNRRFFLCTLQTAALLAISALCFASSQTVRLRCELKSPEKIWVGQRLDLNVTLYTASSFAGDTRFSLPDVPDLLFLAEDSQPLLASETIDGVSYLSKQYTISLFPLRAGTLAIPAFQVDFGYQGDAGAEMDASLSTQPGQLTVLAVPGADPGLALITSENLKVEDQWTPNPRKAEVGDAFKRTVRMTASGVPGMAITPLKMQEIAGLAIYSNPPRVSTDTQRGAFIGKRVETYSIVCQKAGTYVLPAMKIQWWNPADETLRPVVLEPVTLTVLPNPVMEPSAQRPARGTGAFSFGPWGAMATLIVGAVAVFFARRWKKAHRDATAPEMREKALFHCFELAAEANDAPQAMRTLVQWLDATGFVGNCDGLAGFSRMTASPELERQMRALETSVYGEEPTRWSGDSLRKEVAKARKGLPRRLPPHPNKRHLLGSLNP